jgi:hypothetical protein
MSRISPEALYVELGRLLEVMPDLTVFPQPTTTTQWLAKAYALASKVDLLEAATIKDAMQWLTSSEYGREIKASYATSVAQALYRTLAVAELSAPATAQGAFIPAGNAFDALAAVGKVLASATTDLLIVDPYMDENALSKFAVLAAETVPLRLLADLNSVKPSLKPSADAWIKQYGQKRPISVRLAQERTLHDRLIIVDGKEAWVLTQSLNAFAARAPATIVRTDNETAMLKAAAYDVIWNGALSIS